MSRRLARSTIAAFVAALLAGVVDVGCKPAAKTTTLDRGGVHAEQSAIGRTTLRGGRISVQRAGDADGDAIASLRLDEGPNEGPVVELLFVDGKRVTFDRGRLEERNGVAALVQTVVAGGSGELVTTIDANASTLVQHVRQSDATKKTRWTMSRGRFGDTSTSVGRVFSAAQEIPSTSTPWILMHEAVWIGVGSPETLVVQAAPKAISVDVPLHASNGGLEGTLIVSLSDDSSGAVKPVLAARPESGARLVLDPRNQVEQFVRARVLLEGPPAPGIDPVRDAEPDAPIYDVTTPGASIVVPPGKYVLRATHGIGWSMARREIEVKAGDVIDVPFELQEEIFTPAFVGCDFHVHARGSFDATQVSYEDRVRSLVAVGVDCAAATEHNHVGDHGPAAIELHVNEVFRALTGVELTTKNPGFGHFNVYPWPEGAPIPPMEQSNPDAMFDAVHAMKKPGAPDFVFQLNHPRMRSGDTTSIGYLDIVDVDPKTGVAKGPFTYRKDYDTLEVFNGYDLSDPDRVIAMIEEWTRMLDRGDVHVATGNSDSHNMTYPWAGFPRTMVEVGESWRADGRPIEAIVAALKKGKAIVTSGPIVDVRVGEASLGDSVKSSGSVARVTVRITSWLVLPTLRLVLGDHDLPDVALVADEKQPRTFVATVTLPAVDRKRPLVAIVDAHVTEDGAWISGIKRAIAVTNPVWLTP